MTIACALLLSLFGAALFYLSHPHQNLLRNGLPPIMRVAAFVIIATSTWLWCEASGVAAGVASALTCLMFAWVALPYLAWWRGKSAAVVRADKS
jgi:TM2 domain-containing membrane protein YozV